MSAQDFPTLNVIAERLAEVYRDVMALPDEKLERLVAEAERTTDTNCWWLEHVAGSLFASEARYELRRRTNERKDRP